MNEDDPLNQLVETIQVLENPNRAMCLLAVYLGQRGDQNTIQGITGIYSALLGKGEEATTAKVRGLITALVNNKLLERERERMISKTKVSFHQISPLGEIALLYVTAFLTDNPAEIKIDQSQFTSYMAGDSEFKLARFIKLVRLESYMNLITDSLSDIAFIGIFGFCVSGSVCAALVLGRRFFPVPINTGLLVIYDGVLFICFG